MIRRSKFVIVLFVLFSMYSCGSIQLYNSQTCDTWKQCGDTAACAALLYNRASAVMSESDWDGKNKRYLSAEAGYRRAAYMLRCADAKLSVAELSDYEDWKEANVYGLTKTIKDAIKKCDRLIRFYQWRR